uniref:Putative secreted peptide n=1 Tax=Anopheles braziliensis TaxID=58242 RepID=A0A2M3ZEJ1_9DIPT
MRCSSTVRRSLVTLALAVLLALVLLLQPPVTLGTVIQMGAKSKPKGHRQGRIIYTRPSKEFLGAHMLRGPNDPNDKCQHGRKVDRWGYCRSAVVFG